MRRILCLATVVALCIASSNSAVAQDGVLPGFAGPAVQTAFESYYDSYYDYDDYYDYEYVAQEQPPAEESPSDLPPAAEPADHADSADVGCGDACSACDTCCDSCCNCCRRCSDDVNRLFDCCWADQCCIDIGGWLVGSITWNPDSPADRFNGPVTFNDRSNEAMLNQAWFYMGKEANNCGCGIAVGGRVDVVYGTDHRFTMARGLETHGDLDPKWNQGQRFYGLAMPQAYLDVAVNDVTFRMGHFFTIIGYEVVPAPENFFVSHSYSMQYGEPFTHTGVLAMTDLSDTLAISGGFHRGWDNWEDDNDDLSFLGGITWTSCDKNTSLAFAVTLGDEQETAIEDTRFMYSVVFSTKPCDCWEYVLQHDYGYQDDADGGDDAEWYSVNQYLYRKLNDCWKVGVRAEWFRDDDAYRVGGIGDPNGLDRSGWAGNFWELTFGANWSPNANVTVRSEARWDWFDGDRNADGQRPFDDGNDDSQFLWGTDVIVLY